MQALLARRVRLIRRIFNPPSHKDFRTIGNSVEECLRDLEAQAGLPPGDLTLVGEPRAVTSFPAMRNGLNHLIVSNTSAAWKKDPKKEGYISGGVFEATEPSSLTDEQLSKMPYFFALVITAPIVFFGELHIIKNCPGIFKDNACIECGHRVE